MKPGRRGALAVAVLFAVGCGVWLNYVPYVPGRLLAAVPAEATWISVHDNLEPRWDVLVSNPIVRGLAGEALADGDADVAQIRSLFRRETVVAYVPQAGPQRKPAWYILSWVGGRSFQLQWWLNLRPPKTFVEHPIHRGRDYWTVKNRQIAFAFEEGMLIACISEDPEAILTSLVCFDGSAPSAAEQDHRRKDWLVSDAAPDRGWYRAWSVPGERATRFALLAADQHRLQLRAYLPDPVGADAGGDEDFTAPQALFGDLPAGLMSVRVDAMDALLAPWSSTSWATEINAVFRAAGGDRLVLALFGGEYSGRLRGVRVPAIVAASPVPDEARALRAAAASLHRLNERHGWGLSLMEAGAESGVVHLVDSAAGTPYAEQPTEEKIAFGALDGCLLVASNYDTLQRLVARRQWAKAPGGAKPVGMWRVIEDPSPMAGSFDLERSGKAVRNGLAVYSMTQMMSGRPGAAAARERTETIKNAVVGLQKLGTGFCRLNQGADGAEITLEMGRNE